MKNIDPSKELIQSEFCELFEQLPLTDIERNNIKVVYWELYKLFLYKGEVSPSESWVATKNVFISQETQIKERLKDNI